MKKLLCLCLLTLAHPIGGSEMRSFVTLADECNLIIETPSLAKREVKKLRLANGLEALIISDPETHESGAALAVNVGSWDDPFERPGMAHFVEHLLFLGTEKYPEEEGYTRYLDEHGGSRNAYTMADRTVYIFSVNNNGFLEALDRFGQFFISPLFNPSGVERECKAIHQEYCKNLFLDSWRMHFVKKELANKNHPFHGFSIGNQQTLANISQDELKEWYQSHYSANLMHLVVYSPLDIATLEKEVVSLFSQVKDQNKKNLSCSEALMQSQATPSLCFINPVQEVQHLELSWEIPRFYGQDLEIHADKLLSHILGHEGSTSLLAHLKRENLAENLSVSNYRAGRDQCLLSLSVELTTKGIENYEDVIARCFEAIQTLQHSPIPYYIYNEVCQIEELRYRFQSRSDVFDLVSEYAMKLIDEPLETFPKKTLIPSQYAPEKVKELVAHLSPSNCQYTLIAPQRLTKVKATMKEKWFGVDYALVQLKPNQLKKWEEATSFGPGSRLAMLIPRPNPFLPINLTVKGRIAENKEILPVATKICDEPHGKIFVVEDSTFLVPQVSWIFTFKTPFISDADPATQVLADLYCHAIREALNAPSYEALLGGLAFSLSPKHGALELKIRGYSDKASNLLRLVVQEMKNLCCESETFELYKEQFARDYANSLTHTPLKQGTELLWSVLFKDYSSLENKSSSLCNLSFEQMSAFCQDVLSNCYVEAMLYGNISQEEAKGLWKMVKQAIDFTPYPPENHAKIELACLPADDKASYLAITSHQPASALILTMDCGDFSFKRRAAQEILTKGLEEPFFSELRTRQQTAYLVSNSSQELERHLYSFFAIQSSSHDPRDLLARFELFIETSLQELSEKVIPEERFESIRAASIHQLQHPAENMHKMGNLLHTVAFQYEGDFDWLNKRIDGFKSLSYEEFLTLAKEFLGKENTRRLGICVHGKIPKEGNIVYQHVKTPEKLRSEICYKGKASR